ncbi:MAG: hydantoinase B/oxoprolinase family protein, partial [Actinomycetota bacterium]
ARHPDPRHVADMCGESANPSEHRIDRDGGIDSVDDGDVYVFNDPYRGGTHLNDMKLVRPFFWEGRLICHLASVGHFTDVGGAVPGNYNPRATESAEEGVLIPPVKLRRAGELQTDVVDVICAISRAPVNAYGDLNGQLNALDLGVTRLTELIVDYGVETVERILAELTDRAARLMRARLASLPDGTYTATDHLDNDGITDDDVPIELALTVAGEEIHLDFTGTSDAVQGPVNISEPTAVAACYVALKHVFHGVPANSGCLEPVTITLPPDSLLVATHPRPVGGYTETILRVMDVIFRALAEADPELSNGCSYGTINALSLAGHHEDGARWVMFTFYGGGLGGNPVGDGLNHGNAPLSTATIPPLEILEATYPVVFRRWALRADSGGPGEHRGGLGAEYEIEVLQDGVEAFAFGDRALHAPKGVAGGGEAARNEVVFSTGDGEVRPEMGAKATDITLDRGDGVRIASPGGGGYGDPADRDPDATARDVALGYVTGDPTGGAGTGEAGGDDR